MRFSLNPATMSVLQLNQTLALARDKVFRAFTSADMIKKWWFAEGMQMVSVKSSPKPEGELFFQHKAPTGSAVTQEGEWVSVTEDMLVLNLGPDSLHNKEGGTLITIELRAGEGGATTVSLTEEGLASAEAQQQHRKDWIARIDRLAKSVR